MTNREVILAGLALIAVMAAVSVEASPLIHIGSMSISTTSGGEPRFTLAAGVKASGILIRHGTVTTIDDAGKTFGCHWQTGDWTYRTTDKTVFRVGRKAGSWSDLKVGETVQVTYHAFDTESMADLVVVQVQ
jgi:hypothetical protein